ncbi:unnamed protein product [Rotaria sp. Silwood1]|nr:unnamed protein product [Rotaria sp. Silwood1]
MMKIAEVRKDVSRQFQITIKDHLMEKHDAHSPKLFYPAVGFKLEKFVVRCEIAYRLTKNGKFQDQQ